MTLEEEKHQMDIGKKEEEVYSEAGLEDLRGEEDEITDVDEMGHSTISVPIPVSV